MFLFRKPKSTRVSRCCQSRVWPARPAQLSYLRNRERGGATRRGSVLAPDAAEGLTDRRMLGIEGVACDAAGTGDGGDTPAQGWQRVAFASAMAARGVGGLAPSRRAS